MPFVKFPSIENSYRVDKNAVVDPHIMFTVTEKLHGSNVQFIFEPNSDMRIGSRNQITSPNFFNIGEILPEYNEYFLNIQHFSDESKKNINLYGEFIGPKIQKGVDYGKTRKLRFFAVAVDRNFLAFNDFINFLNIVNMQHLCVPIFGTSFTFQEALEFNCEFNSYINPIDGNICEGIVIAPTYNIENLPFFMLKKKNDKFKEKSSRKKHYKNLSNEIMKLNDEFRSYITSQRLDNIISKFGEIKDKKEIGKYIRLLINDAKEDFMKDFDISKFSKGEIRAICNAGNLPYKYIEMRLRP